MSELDRRDFLKMVGLSAGAAATAGCEDPASKLIPYVIQQEEITPGLPVVYASTCRECPAACGIHVRTREGRPILVEGNPEHPVNQGRLCARGTAAIGRTYHPDRIEGPASRGADGSLEAISWDDARSKLAAKLGSAAGRTWVLGGTVGPSLDGLIDQFVAATGIAGRITFEPFGQDSLIAASESVFGVSAAPIFDVSKADLIIDFGGDFIDSGASPTEHARQLAESRDIQKHPDGGAQLVAITPRQNLTASNADHWIAAAPGSEGTLALALARSVADRKGAQGLGSALSGANVADAVSAAGIERSRFDELVDMLVKSKHAVALPPGVAASSTGSAAAASAVLLLNLVVGAIGDAVSYPAADTPRSSSLKDVLALVERMKAGQVDCLLIHDANPVFALPASVGFAEALDKVDLVVSFASMSDETSEAANLLLPDHAPLESWGDASPRPGVRSLVQPGIRPLHDTQALGDTLLSIARAMGGGVASQVPAGSWKSVLESNWAGSDWNRALARGGEFGPTPTRDVSLAATAGSLRPSAPKLAGSGDLTLVPYPHSFWYDGRGASLPWLQEIPDPVTKLSWNSWAELSNATAAKLGVVFGDVVKIQTEAGEIEASVYPRGGIRDDVIALPIGQGHTVGYYASMGWEGQEGVARGANVAAVLPAAVDEAGSQAFVSTRAEVSSTGRFRRLALSQFTDNQRERGLAPEMSLVALAKGGADDSHGGGHGDDHGSDHGDDHGGDHGGGDGHGAAGHHFEGPPFEFEPAFDAEPDQPYRWGMTIDNDRCTGCSACVAACYVENNVSIVGEENAIRHREMSWLRIERYVGDGEVDFSDGAERRPVPNGESLGKNEVRHLPMLCQHCGAAPCEAVCPVIATYHTPEGINGMVYNRCVGTRYCANNCTYKVRRFNYFDYGRLNWPGLLGLMLNPDVTVRGQGVMEKCTFCVQRIEAARQGPKDRGEPIPTGGVRTACQQACPTDAIQFGNLRDAESPPSKLRKEAEPRAYHALQILNTRAAVTYFAQVRRDKNEGVH